MGRFYNTLVWGCVVFLFINRAHCLPHRLLYEHINRGTNLPAVDDVSSPEIKLNVPIVFYGQTYTSIFVNSNGLLSFQTDIPTFFNIEFPLAYPVIAPLYSNVDIGTTGTISYYETDDPGLLQRATTNIRDSFSYANDYTATSLFVVTWSKVGYHKNGADKLNTFQVAISSNGEESYIELLYPENGIQWIQGTGDESGLPDARAQAGFVASDGRFFRLEGSGTDLVKNLERWSNLNLPGQWIFRVGRINPESNIEEPDIFNDENENGIVRSCEKGANQCHVFAKCVDYNEGFCCHCKKQYYGNGKFCIKNDAPLRVNGKVNGDIYGEKLINLDLQSYIVLSDGRAYTAISKIPESIGPDIQSLQILGSVLGWVFAKPVSDAINGFHLTGGVFNHTSTIVFTNTNQKITVRQKYVGLDVFDQLKLDVEIHGEIPHIPPDSKVTMREYEEQLTLTAPNTIQSSSTRSFSYSSLDENEIVVPYTVDQSVIFDSCKFAQTPVGTTWRSKVLKNFISYENTEQIVRYGLSNKIGPIGEIDPCAEGRASCGSNSACVVENDSFRCICNPGYQYIYKETGETVCEDVNECQTGLHDCDYNAQCINEVGSYSCRCNAGFDGNGRFCENAQSCQNVQCAENAECVENNGIAICQCISGFTGNGQLCTPLTSRSCDVAHNCSPYGFCTISPQTNTYTCVCLPGFLGDGYNCEKEEILYPPTTVDITTTEIATEEPVTAFCLFGLCSCPSGYNLESDTSYCYRIPDESTTEVIDVTTNEIDSETESLSCNEINNCHRDAQCVYEISISNYHCVCNIGFEGDGYDCKESEISCAQSDFNVCDIHATCTYNENVGRSICVCDPGYAGNGKECHLVTGCVSNNDCPLNEQCLFTSGSQSYECVCKEGYSRDSQQQCVQLQGLCGRAVCAENAECLYDYEYQTYYCVCKADYSGDGITECKPKCNVHNNCGLHASCVYEQQSSSYYCKCNDGFLGDGFLCYVEKNCHIDPYVCDSHAICIPNAERKYVCECQPGYVGNGSVCQQSPKHEGNFLLLNQGKATLRIPFDPSQRNSAKLTHINEYQTAVGLDIDCLAGRVYWSDISTRAIKSSYYNGSSVSNFITEDIGSPEGLSVDWVSRNIYWTDSTKDTIEVANLETKLRAVLFNTSLVNPRGIAVHPQRGKIFWSDWDRKDPKIEWANADGTGREIFLKGENVQLPNSLAIDFETERLCYADAGSKKIECVDIDSRYKQTIAENCTYPFGIAVTDEHVYWSDWIVKKIERADKRSLQRLSPLDVPLGGTNKLYGLVAVAERCLGLSNVCQYYKNQCSSEHICLPDGNGSRRCVCGQKIDSPLERPSCAT